MGGGATKLTLSACFQNGHIGTIYVFINPLRLVNGKPVKPVCVYFGQTFVWMLLCGIVLEELSAAAMCVDVCVCPPLSPRHGRTGRVRSHERTIHEDRGGLPARLLRHRQRKVSDGCRHRCTPLSACLHTSVCSSQPHTLVLLSSGLFALLKTSALIPCH